MEVEAKFSIPDEQIFRQLLETTSLAGFSLGETSVAEFHDRYLDTMGGAIRAGGYACRLRQKDGRYLATLKGLGAASGAVHRRVEYEVGLLKPLAFHDWPPGEARDLALRLCGDELPVTLFIIEQTRHSRCLYEGTRAVAELSLDRVRVRRGKNVAAAYLELEAELLPDGREQDLERLAVELQGTWGLVPESQSKFERALALLGTGPLPDEEIE